MSRKILIGLSFLVLVLAVVVSMQPATFTVERSATIAAPTPQLYAQIANLRAMEPTIASRSRWLPPAARPPSPGASRASTASSRKPQAG